MMTSVTKSLINRIRRAVIFTTSVVSLSLLLCGFGVSVTSNAYADETAEYSLKALFLYNFAIFTSWPDRNVDNFNLCIYGEDPFGSSLDSLMKSKRIYERVVSIYRKSDMKQLDSCQLVFISRSAVSSLPDVIHVLKDKPVLTVADSPHASQQGVILNMNVIEDRVSFEANLAMAKRGGLNLSSQLLRLATEIYR